MLGLYVAVTQPQKYTKKSKDDVEHAYGEDKIRRQNHFVDWQQRGISTLCLVELWDLKTAEQCWLGVVFVQIRGHNEQFLGRIFTGMAG